MGGLHRSSPCLLRRRTMALTMLWLHVGGCTATVTAFTAPRYIKRPHAASIVRQPWSLAPCSTRVRVCADLRLSTAQMTAGAQSPIRRNGTMLLASRGGEEEVANETDRTGVRTAVYLGLWVAFVAYAFLLAPGGSSPDAKAADMDLLMQLVSNPFAPSANPVFVAVFNFLGIMPAVYTLLLLPGSRDQKPLPAWPFTSLSFFLGLFAVGPYLALREHKPVHAPPRAQWAQKAVENKAIPALLLVGALFLAYILVTSIAATQGEALSAYVDLFTSRMFVHVSSLDLLVLSAAVWEPMREDMLRRDWYTPTRLAALSAVPVIGPCLYLLLRPSYNAATDDAVKQK